MRNFWQRVVRFRIVLAIISIVALAVTVWLRNTTRNVATPTEAAEMTVETAVNVGNSIKDAPLESPEVTEGPKIAQSGAAIKVPSTPPPVHQASSHAGATTAVNPNVAVKDAMAAPTVQSGQISALRNTNSGMSIEQGLLNSTQK